MVDEQPSAQGGAGNACHSRKFRNGAGLTVVNELLGVSSVLALSLLGCPLAVSRFVDSVVVDAV